MLSRSDNLRFDLSLWRESARAIGRTCLFSLVVGLGGASLVQAEVSKEYQVKAAFLYNFTKFVEWPSQRFTDATAPIVVGILGQNPFGHELENIVRNRTVNGRSIVVRELASVAEARDVHLLFVSAAETKRFGELTTSLQASGTVIVSEVTGSARGSGVIVFTLREDQVRFEIDQGAAELSGVRLSAQLLKLATVVHKRS